MNKSGKKAFTLIEIMVVVVILGVLVSFFFVDIMSFWGDTKENLAKTQINALRRIIHKFHSDLNKYPKDFAELIQYGYLKSLPINPLNNKMDWEARSININDSGMNYTVANEFYETANDYRGTIWKVVNQDGTIVWDNGTDYRLFDVRFSYALDPGSYYSVGSAPDPDNPPIDDSWRGAPKE